MKARPFLALILAVSTVAFGLGLSGWWLVVRQGPLALAHHPLSMPRAAQFVPRQAPLSLYLLADGEGLSSYARAVAPPRRRRAAAAAIDRLRDGAFAAAGLDYPSELASWLAPDITLAIIEGSRPSIDPGGGNPLPPEPGWLLALSSRDHLGARQFLQRFWQVRSLAGADLQVSSYRGMGLISGRGNLMGNVPVPLATALVDDDLVLIASGRGVMEQALDVSQIDELNQAGQRGLAEQLEAMGQGTAFLVARPAAMDSWLGLALPEQSSQRSSQLLASLRPTGRSLLVAGVVDRLGTTLQIDAEDDPDRVQTLLTSLRGTPSALALLQNPAALMSSPLLHPFLERAVPLSADAGPIPAKVAGADSGPLLVAQGSGGWVLGTLGDNPDPAVLEKALGADGLTTAPLEGLNSPVIAWIRLLGSAVSTRPSQNGDEDQLRAFLAGWRREEGGLAWWGHNLAEIEAKGSAQGVLARRRQLESLHLPQAAFRWALGAEPARSLLSTWPPWRILSALAGGEFDPSVQGIALALEPRDSSLAFEALLEFGS